MRRTIRWEIERGHLVRHVQRADGRAYTHRCELPALQEVCWYVEEHTKDGVTTGELWDAMPDWPATQLSVALEFLKERGVVETHRRRNYPASGTVFEDAMTEFYSLEA
jgi:hypothetical protein